MDPGFEAEGAWTMSGGYVGGNCPAFGGGPSPARTTGTSFMPTDGTYFVAMRPDAAMTMTIEQNGVFLDAVTELVFDYSISQPPANAYGDVTIEWLFTSQGTTTLWGQQFPQATGIPPTEKRDQVVSFSPFPQSGRLMFRLSQNCSGMMSPPGGPTVLFAIDNIRVR